MNGKFLKKTIKGILKQKYPNIEIIVIDGGSENKNISCLKSEFKNDIDYWVSKKIKEFMMVGIKNKTKLR